MDLVILIWACAATVFSAIGAGWMFHTTHARPDDDERRARRIRFLTFIVGWLWIMFGLIMITRLTAKGLL